MPVATARALVAAVAGAPLPGPGTRSAADGIPAVRASEPPAAEAAPAAAAAPEDASMTASAGAPSQAGASASSGAAASPAGAASPKELDELARRLYDPLATRLRSELLLDRERRGLRTDAW
jgi:hypothetical protein